MSTDVEDSTRKPALDWQLRLILLTLFVSTAKALFDVLIGGRLTLLQIVVNTALFIMVIRFRHNALKWVIWAAIGLAIFWTVITYAQSGALIAVIVGIGEWATCLALLLLAIGKPGPLRMLLAMLILGIFTVAFYLVMLAYVFLFPV